MAQSYSPAWENGAIEPNLQTSEIPAMPSRLVRHGAPSKDLRHHARRSPQTGLRALALTLLIVRLSRMNIKGGLFRRCGQRSFLQRICAGCDRGVSRLTKHPGSLAIAASLSLFARGIHLAGAFANGSFGFTGIGDVSDGGVHGTLPVTRAVHYKGNQVLAVAGYPVCQ